MSPYAAPKGCRYRPEGWHRHHASSPAVSREAFLRNPHFSIVLPFHISGGIGGYPTWPRPRSRRRQHARDGINKLCFTRRIPPNPPSFFIFISANLRLYVPSDTASRPSWPRDPSINHPAPLARHLGSFERHLKNTSSAAPPAVVPSVPFHRSPFSLLLSGNRT